MVCRNRWENLSDSILGEGTTFQDATNSSTSILYWVSCTHQLWWSIFLWNLDKVIWQFTIALLVLYANKNFALRKWSRTPLTDGLCIFRHILCRKCILSTNPLRFIAFTDRLSCARSPHDSAIFVMVKVETTWCRMLQVITTTTL